MTEKPDETAFTAERLAEIVFRDRPDLARRDDDRQEKNRQLARLGAAMPRLVNR